MKNIKNLSILLILSFTILFSGCAKYTHSDIGKIRTVSIGKIIQIENIEIGDDWKGKAIGGVLGGLLGAKMGGSKNAKGGAVIGAVVGAGLGHMAREAKGQKILVKLKNGQEVELIHKFENKNPILYVKNQNIKIISSGNEVIEFKSLPTYRKSNKKSIIVRESKSYTKSNNKTIKNLGTPISKTNVIKKPLYKSYKGELLDYNIIGENDKGQIAIFEIMENKTFKIFKIRGHIGENEFFETGNKVNFKYNVNSPKANGSVWI